jgi:hypothetical protein
MDAKHVAEPLVLDKPRWVYFDVNAIADYADRGQAVHRNSAARARRRPDDGARPWRRGLRTGIGTASLIAVLRWMFPLSGDSRGCHAQMKESRC